MIKEIINKLAQPKSSQGFSLVEALVYVAILGMVISITVSFFSDLMQTYSKTSAKSDVTSNISSALKIISDEIKYASGIYTPTTVLNSNPGQLSLETTFNAPTGHSSTYIDYYLDNGVIYEKREGSSATPLTSNRVFITTLKFERFISNGKDAVKVMIDGKINTASTNPEYQANISLTSTVSLRGSY